MKLYGKKPVLERIKADPGSIEGLYLQKKTDLSEIVKASKKEGLEFVSVDKKWFRENCPGAHSQGVTAYVREFRYCSLDDILLSATEEDVVPVFLDRVTDPQNLGSIIRSLACLGGFSIVLPEHEAVHVTETVLRVASGGENHIKICKVTNLATAAKKTREKGICLAGTLMDKEGKKEGFHAVSPMAVLVGSEGNGLRPGLRKLVDMDITLPMKGAGLSYNVAVATALICYEINRQKERKKK